MVIQDGPGLFALLVRRHRAALGLSQDELAERAALSRRGISDLERGARRAPHPSTLRRLADALGLAGADRTSFMASARQATRRNARAASMPSLPIPPSTFVGRTEELSEVRRLLDERRLVTITGAGGSGKTRLAIEVARAIGHEYGDGAALVLLAPLAAPELVAPAIAHVLGARERGNHPIRDTLLSHVQKRHLLLVLDNFEHLLDAAPLVGELLAACEQLRVLATSREGLHLREEQEFPLAPLALPDGAADRSVHELLSYASIELFRQRAAQLNPHFDITPETAHIVAEICLRLDGLPLAIELAAARTKLLPPAVLLERLDHRLPLLVDGARDLPARQRALRDTIAWSHDLLAEGEQRLFRHMAVLVGGGSLQAVEALGASDADAGAHVLNELQSLVEKNLVRCERGAGGEPRYTMLETIREFAHDELAAHGELEQARRQHAAYYLSWLEPGDARELAKHPRGWIRRLDFEYDNLRAAVRWSLDHGCLAHVLAAGPALTRYGHMRGYLRELRAWWQEALDHSAEGEPSDWPRAACLLAVVLFLHRDEQPVIPLLKESLERFRALGDKRGVAHVLLQLGSAAPVDGDPSAGIPPLREAEALFRELGQHEDVAWSIWNRGNLLQLEGDLLGAESLCTQALAIVRGVRRPTSVSQALGLEGLAGSLLINLGSLALARGDLERADACLREAARLSVEIASPELLSVCVMNMAGVSLARGDRIRAARLLGGAEGLWGAVDSGLLPVYRAVYDRIRSDLDRSLGEELASTLRADGQQMRSSEVGAYAVASVRAG